MNETKPLAWADQAGRTWQAAISLADAKRLKNAQKIDFFDASCMEVLFGTCTIARVETIAELARPQWEAELDFAAFADLIVETEQTFADASDAFRQALSHFYRRVGLEQLAVFADRAWEAMAADAAMRLKQSQNLGELFDSTVARNEREIERALDEEIAKFSAD